MEHFARKRQLLARQNSAIRVPKSRVCTLHRKPHRHRTRRHNVSRFLYQSPPRWIAQGAKGQSPWSAKQALTLSAYCRAAPCRDPAVAASLLLASSSLVFDFNWKIPEVSGKEQKKMWSVLKQNVNACCKRSHICLLQQPPDPFPFLSTLHLPVLSAG